MAERRLHQLLRKQVVLLFELDEVRKRIDAEFAVKFNANYSSEDGTTLLDLAIDANDPHFCQILIDNGANPFLNIVGTSPFASAAKKQDAACVKVLASHGMITIDDFVDALTKAIAFGAYDSCIALGTIRQDLMNNLPSSFNPTMIKPFSNRMISVSASDSRKCSSYVEEQILTLQSICASQHKPSSSI